MPKRVPYTLQRVDSWAGAKRIFSKLTGDWIFRGQSNSAWSLETSIDRQVFGPLRRRGIEFGAVGIERILEEEFKRGAHLFLDESNLPDSRLGWFALMQHYGMPTRLLDFSESPYVASFFAFEDGAKTTDRAIWALGLNALDVHKENVEKASLDEEYRNFLNRIPGRYLPGKNPWVDDKLMSDFIGEADKKNYRIIVPAGSPWVNERMMVQQSHFVMPSTIQVNFMQCLEDYANNPPPQGLRKEALVKVVIPNEARIKALVDLQLMNITRASLFPGLEGFARSIATNYEVMLGKVDIELALQTALFNQFERKKGRGKNGTS